MGKYEKLWESTKKYGKVRKSMEGRESKESRFTPQWCKQTFVFQNMGIQTVRSGHYLSSIFSFHSNLVRGLFNPFWIVQCLIIISLMRSLKFPYPSEYVSRKFRTL